MISEESLGELMREAPRRWITFQAVYSRWWHQGRLLEAVDHNTAAGAATRDPRSAERARPVPRLVRRLEEAA